MKKTIEDIRRSFAFLEERDECKAVEVEENQFVIVVRYLMPDVALEIEYDFREEFAFFLLVKLHDGKLPGGYYLSEGERCRIHLQDAVRKISLSCSQDVKAKDHVLVGRSRDSGRVDIHREIGEVADLVQSILPELLGNSEVLFS